MEKVHKEPGYHDPVPLTCGWLCQTLGYDSDYDPRMKSVACEHPGDCPGDHYNPVPSNNDGMQEADRAAAKVAEEVHQDAEEVLRSEAFPSYDYSYDEKVGTTADGTPEQVMAYFQAHPQNIFPFPVTGCSSFTNGAQCVLHPGDSTPFGVGNLLKGTGTVSVTVTPTSEMS